MLIQKYKGISKWQNIKNTKIKIERKPFFNFCSSYLRVARIVKGFIIHMSKAASKEFFSKLWKCPIRRLKRYGRKFLLVIVWGIVVWMGLDFAAIFINKPPQHYPSFFSLLLHALLTISLSLILTLTTHQLYLRFNSRFKLIRTFQSSRRNHNHE